MSVAVVTCLYGEGYERFVAPWIRAVEALAPDEIIVATEHLVGPCRWRYPQAYYQQKAFEATSCDWVWKLDIDDAPFPDALDGIQDVQADVWQMGYVRPDGSQHVPPQLTAEDYLALDSNPFVGSSAVRLDAFHRAGGYPDAAFEDWGLWRRLARAGATFESSGRTHFRYNSGPYTRSETELTADRRAAHLAEIA